MATAKISEAPAREYNISTGRPLSAVILYFEIIIGSWEGNIEWSYVPFTQFTPMAHLKQFL